MTIGLMGTGLMGLPMAERILAANLPLIVYNRTPDKLAPLQTAGAAIATSPDQVVQASDCIVLMLSDGAVIQDVLLSEACRAQLASKTIIQMGTIAPSQSRALQQEILASQGDYLEAPVLGSIPEAKTGTLMVMVGSTVEQFDRWQPLLGCFGKPRRVGEVGSAAAIKLALNQLIGSLTAAFGTSLEFVRQQGAEVEPFMEILRESALYAPTFDKKLQRMMDGNYANPNFPTKHLLKDTTLFLNESASLPLDTKIPGAVQAILQAAIAQGLDEDDYSALFAAIQNKL
jgi:3-hydroxyisobutyrate dehydrogenase